MLLDEEADVPVGMTWGLEDLDLETSDGERILTADALIDGAAAEVLDLLALGLRRDQWHVGEGIEHGGVPADMIGVPVGVEDGDELLTIILQRSDGGDGRRRIERIDEHELVACLEQVEVIITNGAGDDVDGETHDDDLYETKRGAFSTPCLSNSALMQGTTTWL